MRLRCSSWATSAAARASARCSGVAAWSGLRCRHLRHRGRWQRRWAQPSVAAATTADLSSIASVLRTPASLSMPARHHVDFRDSAWRRRASVAAPHASAPHPASRRRRRRRRRRRNRPHRRSRRQRPDCVQPAATSSAAADNSFCAGARAAARPCRVGGLAATAVSTGDSGRCRR